jgi:hypothetical protein
MRREILVEALACSVWRDVERYGECRHGEGTER